MNYAATSWAKCRNGFQVAKKPSRDQRDAWVTLLAEPDKNRDQLSPLALRVVDYVRRNLDDEGYDFELNLDDTGGVAYAEVHFRTLTKAEGKKNRSVLNSPRTEPRTQNRERIRTLSVSFSPSTSRPSSCPPATTAP